KAAGLSCGRRRPHRDRQVSANPSVDAQPRQPFAALRCSRGMGPHLQGSVPLAPYLRPNPERVRPDGPGGAGIRESLEFQPFGRLRCLKRRERRRMKACLFTGVCIWVVSVVAIPAADHTFHLPDIPYQYAYLDLPSHFTETRAQNFDNTPADNPITDAGATLGRVLFYDTRLSANSTISCGSCHVQSHAFVDPNRFSKGFKGGLTDRHAMNLVN